VIANLARALLAALAAGVLPGYYWAGFVRRAGGVAERLAYSAVLSMAAVPAIALILSWVFHTGVTLVVAIAAVVIVAGSGALAIRLKGPASDPAGPALPRPPAIRDGRALALVIVATGLALAVALGLPAPGWLLIVILAAAAAGGLLSAATAARSPVPGARAPGPAAPDGPADPAPGLSRWGLRRAWHGWTLTAILAVTAIRGYTGVVWHDWPNLRGQDMFSHAVMTEQMLAHGSYGSYLIYPPGFATMSAVISRLCGLPPLPLFAAATPALLLLTTLAAYALATGLWGRNYGLVAAALSGLVLVGPNVSFSGGLYPDLLAAFFFMVMTVAALVTFFQSPTIRSGLLVAVAGAAVVLYHSVGTEYLALLLGSVAVVCLPYLFLRGPAGRDLGRALILALAAAGVLSLAYAWRTYGLGELTGRGATARAQVGLDMGSQPVLRAGDLLDWVGSPVIWLGVLGFAALAVLVVRQLRQPGQVASALTVLAWCATMYAGSRTAIDGFPQRFERDAGAPLALLAALGAGLILQSLLQLWRASRAAVPAEAAQPSTVSAGPVSASVMSASTAPASTGGAGPATAERGPAGMTATATVTGPPAAADSPAPVPSARARSVLALAAVAVVVVACGVQAGSNLVSDSQRSREVLPPAVAAAGAWLRQHNTGGTIITTPDLNRGLTNRAVLAMGGYTGLQAYPLARIIHPRSLPTAGRQPLLDSRMVLLYPADCQSASILSAEQVRYIFLYRFGNEANYDAFAASTDWYRPVFANSEVLIYATVPGASC
jgi:hypothetical protein